MTDEVCVLQKIFSDERIYEQTVQGDRSNYRPINH